VTGGTAVVALGEELGAEEEVPFEGVLDEGGVEEVLFEELPDEDDAGVASRLPLAVQSVGRDPDALGVTWKVPEHA